MSFTELYPEAEWKLWYQDMFDRETPRQVEIAGRGLVRGLAELWTRHLKESVMNGGQPGFARFNLWWEQESRSITIQGDRDGMRRLRAWLLGDRLSPPEGTLLDQDLLARVASSHAKLVVMNQNSVPILDAANSALNRKDFEKRLHVLNEGTTD